MSEAPDDPTLAEYEPYIRKQVAEEPYSTYARGVVRDLFAEVDRLRAIEQRVRQVAADDSGRFSLGQRATARYILDEPMAEDVER